MEEPWCGTHAGKNRGCKVGQGCLSPGVGGDVTSRRMEGIRTETRVPRVPALSHLAMLIMASQETVSEQKCDMSLLLSYLLYFREHEPLRSVIRACTGEAAPLLLAPPS